MVIMYHVIKGKNHHIQAEMSKIQYDLKEVSKSLQMSLRSHSGKSKLFKSKGQRRLSVFPIKEFESPGQQGGKG